MEYKENAEIRETMNEVRDIMKSKQLKPVDQFIGYLLSGYYEYLPYAARRMMVKYSREDIMEELLQVYLSHYSPYRDENVYELLQSVCEIAGKKGLPVPVFQITDFLMHEDYLSLPSEVRGRFREVPRETILEDLLRVYFDEWSAESRAKVFTQTAARKPQEAMKKGSAKPFLLFLALLAVCAAVVLVVKFVL